MILPKNAASLISDSLATARKGGEGAPEAEEPMDEMEALGQSILDAIKSGNPKDLAESLKGFQQAVSYVEPEPLEEPAAGEEATQPKEG